MGHWKPLEWLILAEHELLLFAAAFFLVGALDELVVDLIWFRLRVTGRARSIRIDRREARERPLRGSAAVFIATWREEQVIEFTVAHALAAWPQADLRLYVGCYCNDPDTLSAIMRGARGDSRLRVVVVGRPGPTTKADCLNRLYAAMEHDEVRLGRKMRLVLLHDAEDMVDPAALGVVDAAMDEVDFVQLPVLPEAQAHSRWIGSHYIEEFAESHGKAMAVREALSASLPAAGVGCAFARATLGKLVARPGAGPFSVESLTEDYELGIRIRAAGGRARFLRARGEDGRLVATRACFPARFGQAVRQKGRWTHGIALQGWDRLGWDGGIGEFWMLLRDRRGPFSALVLSAGYLVLLILVVLWLAGMLGMAVRPVQADPLLMALLIANMLSFGWRVAMRFAFTARDYGWREGLRAVARIPVSNVVTICAGRRALTAYVGTLFGARLQWDKTVHDAHPAAMSVGAAAA